MPFEQILFALLHLLAFAYWLGGDIGAFYASTLLTDEKREPAGRVAAAKILSDVDLAPRICLLLTFPTGLALANAKGWLQVGGAPVVAAFVIAIAWIYGVVRMHLTHGGGAWMKRGDIVLRYVFLAGLASAAVGGLAGVIDLPLFLALKFLALAFAIAMGLVIRKMLEPFGPAFATLATDGPDEQTNQTIKSCLDRARPAVVAIWAALATAAWLGVSTPM